MQAQKEQIQEKAASCCKGLACMYSGRHSSTRPRQFCKMTSSSLGAGCISSSPSSSLCIALLAISLACTYIYALYIHQYVPEYVYIHVSVMHQQTQPEKVAGHVRCPCVSLISMQSNTQCNSACDVCDTLHSMHQRCPTDARRDLNKPFQQRHAISEYFKKHKACPKHKD